MPGDPESFLVRPETPEDRITVDALYEAAFDSRVEAELVEVLRRDCAQHFALVAEREGRLVGHILFTPMLITESENEQKPLVEGLGLGPMAVLPEDQNQGVGSRLVEEGLTACRSRGAAFVIVLGHPEYYPRFGFEPASRHAIRSQWAGVPDDAFLIQVFEPASMPPEGGVARYRDEFERAV